MKKSIKISIILILICVDLTFGYLVFNKYKSKPESKPNLDYSNNQGSIIEEKQVSEKFSKFTDPNFSIDIPDSWGEDAGYEPGSSLVLFTSAEFGGDKAQSAKGARLNIYVFDRDKDRIEEQIESLIKNKSEYKIINDKNDVKFGNYTGRLIELQVSSRERPDAKSHIFSIFVRGENKSYSADIIFGEEYLDIHKENAEKILKSFVPLN